jgi:NAD(P)-dependent dehydrogenase (short-subunit alcohol dehydrogenase family)
MSMALLADQCCLVLDAGDGVGTAIADVLRTEGAQVWRAGEGGDVPFGGGAREVDGACAAARQFLGALHAIVGPAPTLASVRPQDWDAKRYARLAAAHGEVTAAIGKAALKHLTPPAAVCLLGTIWGLAGAPDTGLAGGAQAALGPMTKALALEGAARGIRANTVYLGLIDTPAMRAWCAARAETAGVDGDVFARTVAKVPMGRAGTAQEVGKSVAFLLSGRARHVNGVTVLVDGGLLYA